MHFWAFDGGEPIQFWILRWQLERDPCLWELVFRELARFRGGSGFLWIEAV